MPRPRKAEADRHTEHLTMRLTKAQQAQLEADAQAAGMNPRALARHRVVTGRTPKAAPPIINRDAFVELVRIGTNVNQIAHRLNAGGHVPGPVLDEAAQQITATLKRLMADGAARRG